MIFVRVRKTICDYSVNFVCVRKVAVRCWIIRVCLSHLDRHYELRKVHFTQNARHFPLECSSRTPLTPTSVSRVVISGFRREVDEICTLLGYYAAYRGKNSWISGPLMNGTDTLSRNDGNIKLYVNSLVFIFSDFNPILVNPTIQKFPTIISTVHESISCVQTEGQSGFKWFTVRLKCGSPVPCSYVARNNRACRDMTFSLYYRQYLSIKAMFKFSG